MTSDQPLVEVLLATYNGERFLHEQIDSILGQDYEHLRILARDDGSTDSTAAILNHYAANFPDRFRLLPAGPPTGSPRNNFLILMQASVADYICFADQDDVWLPHKVRITKQALGELESQWSGSFPLLVFTDVRVVDDRLLPLHESLWAHEGLDPDRIHRLASLLAQNVVTGCTAMLNRKMANLSVRMSHQAVMHDQWIALIAATLGKAAALPVQTVLYRQHDRNLVGSERHTGSLREFSARASNSTTRLALWRASVLQAKSFLSIYHSELGASDKQVLEAYVRTGAIQNRFVRIYNIIRFGFLRGGVLRKLASLADQLRF